MLTSFAIFFRSGAASPAARRLVSCLVLGLALLCPALAAQEAAANPAVANPYASRDKGLSAMGQGVYGAAAEFFLDYRKATGLREPDFADATIHLVKAWVMAGDTAKAAEALEYHRARSQDLTEAYYLHALQYWRAVILRAEGHLRPAQQAVQPLLDRAVEPELRQNTLYLLADLDILQQRWPEAEAHLQRLLQEFPGAPQAVRARLRLVSVLLVTQRLPQAEAILDDLQGSVSEADDREVTRSRVLLAVQRGELDRAVELYRGIAAGRPREPDAEWWITSSALSAALCEAGRHEDALAILPQVSAMALTEDQRVESLLRTAEAQIALQRLPQAIDSLERFKRDYPRRPESVPVLIRLGELLRQTNNAATAVAYFADVMAHPGASPAYRYRAAISRAGCLKEAGVPEQAVKAYLEAEAYGSSATEKAQAVLLAAETAFALGDYAAAAANYGAVCERYRETAFGEEARFRQARALFELKSFAESAAAYARFIAEFPQSPQLETARLERAMALRRSAGSREEFQAAFAELWAFTEQHPGAASVPRALMEAYEAALGAGDSDGAVLALTTVIDSHPAAELYPDALYHRTVMYFMRAEYDKAVADGEAFLEKFSALPLAPDIMLQLGDHHANRGDFEQAKGCFSMLASKHPQSALAPVALYEAARCSYRLEQLDSALVLLDQILAMDNPKPKADVLARAEFLYGDTLARQDQYEKALEHFARARDLAGETRLGIAAQGRRGEMLYALAGVDKARLDEAIQCFTALTEARSTPADLWEIATYRLAKCHEQAGDYSRAIKSYLDIFYQYEQDRRQNRRRDYLYLARSVYDAARLLEISGRKNDLSTAATLYEYYADLELPTAEDARRRARQIRERHDLAQ
ncbi:MAG: tetratricopeptide repeat protein [Lentisphaerae bacterium]|nr:tetratricopeptide repeat protein [Lentisphaerota bacterium]